MKQKVKCYECGKTYDYAEDAFCPACGAFNQPPAAARIGAEGRVVRVDGLNEACHEDSFTHEEYHKEEAERRRMGLDWISDWKEHLPQKAKEFQELCRQSAGKEKGKQGRPPLAKFLRIVFWCIVAWFGLGFVVNLILGILFTLEGLLG